MTPYYQDDAVTIYHGDCLDVLRALPDASVDSVCTDPPYNLGFMGKGWDTFGGRAMSDETRERQLASGAGWTKKPYGASGKPAAPAPGESLAFQQWCEIWTAECLRVLKPGGHMLAFGGSRTWHRLACAVEDAGFEVRDSIAWLYGSGFPKSMSVAKAIEATLTQGGSSSRMLKATELAGDGDSYAAVGRNNGIMGEPVLTERKTFEPETDEAKAWDGWGTALKPAFEPVVVARKPLTGTVAQNVLAHGTGALNIDACRVEGAFESGWSKSGSKAGPNDSMSGDNYARDPKPDNPAGRWPANVVLDQHAAAELDRQSGERAAGNHPAKRGGDRDESVYGLGHKGTTGERRATEAGGASRFFYVAKAPKSERPRHNGTAHPTVKPLTLMSWLVRLVTPPGGTVLEPFAGSGTTVEACIVEGFHCIAIEREADYLPLIMQRVNRRRDPVAYIEAAGDDLGRKAVLIEREERYCEIAANRMRQEVLPLGM